MHPFRCTLGQKAKKVPQGSSCVDHVTVESGDLGDETSL